RRVDPADRVRRADAEHDQQDRRRVRARLLHRAARRRGARVPRARRHVEDELGRDALLGGDELHRPAGRVVAVLLPRRGARFHRPRPRPPARRDRRGEQPAPADGGFRMTALMEAPNVTRSEKATLLELQHLVVEYGSGPRRTRAVDGVDLAIHEGEVVGLAGESGCGKTTVANAVMRILRPPGRITGGSILFRGEDLTSKSTEELRRFRWRNVSMVFQGAMNALNPVMRVGDQF